MLLLLLVSQQNRCNSNKQQDVCCYRYALVNKELCAVSNKATNILTIYIKSYEH